MTHHYASPWLARHDANTCESLCEAATSPLVGDDGASLPDSIPPTCAEVGCWHAPRPFHAAREHHASRARIIITHVARAHMPTPDWLCHHARNLRRTHNAVAPLRPSAARLLAGRHTTRTAGTHARLMARCVTRSIARACVRRLGYISSPPQHLPHPTTTRTSHTPQPPLIQCHLNKYTT